jgi:hypothetical protein
VDVTPIAGVTWPQPRSSLGISPETRSDFCQSTAPLSLSKAYTVSFSLATNTTLWEAPATLSAERYSGCASILPSVARKRSLPKLELLTFASVRTDSVRF